MNPVAGEKIDLASMRSIPGSYRGSRHLKGTGPEPPVGGVVGGRLAGRGGPTKSFDPSAGGALSLRNESTNCFPLSNPADTSSWSLVVFTSSSTFLCPSAAGARATWYQPRYQPKPAKST